MFRVRWRPVAVVNTIGSSRVRAGSVTKTIGSAAQTAGMEVSRIVLTLKRMASLAKRNRSLQAKRGLLTKTMVFVIPAISLTTKTIGDETERMRVVASPMGKTGPIG